MAEKISTSIPGFIDLLLDAVCIVDEEGRYVYVSAAYEQIFGYTPEEIIGRRMIDLVAPEDRERTLAAANNVMAGNSHLHFENRYIRKDGRVVNIMWSARWSQADRLRIAVARDITDLKHAEALQSATYAISEAAHTAEDLPALFKQVQAVLARLLPADNFAVGLLDETTGNLSLKHLDTNSFPAAYADIAACRTLCTYVAETHLPLLLTPHDKDHPMYPLLSHHGEACWLGVPLTTHNKTIGALGLMSISGDCHYTARHRDLLQYVSTQVATAIERKQLHERLQYLAQYDSLTGLPNRALLHDRLDHALALARRNHGKLAVLFVDLDQFKSVNDQLGHAEGDALLQEIALRLKKCVRESDTVARLSGDEFVIILESLKATSISDDAGSSSTVGANKIISKLKTSINEPIVLGSHTIKMTASIGLARFPEHGDTPNQLLKHADKAMYQAKRQHRIIYSDPIH